MDQVYHYGEPIDYSLRTHSILGESEQGWTLESGPEEAPSALDIDVAYVILSWGTPDGWMEPGDPMEIEVYVANFLVWDEASESWFYCELSLIPDEEAKVIQFIGENAEPGDDYDD